MIEGKVIEFQLANHDLNVKERSDVCNMAFKKKLGVAKKEKRKHGLLEYLIKK